jgi:peroxiredoxin
LEYDIVHEYYVLPSDKEIEQMIERAKFLLGEGNEVRKKIQTRSKELSDSAKKMIEVLRK